MVVGTLVDRALERGPLRRHLGALVGHAYTVGPHVAGSLRAPRAPARAWTAPAPRHPHRSAGDGADEPVRLTGLFTDGPRERPLVVVLHGLGGDATRPYVARAALAARSAGVACLRLDMRGARGGGDFYHAGLTADVGAALASPDLAGFERVVVLGYSIGGHVALRLATEPLDARVRAVAAVGPPLDLERGARAIDEPARWPYRRHLLSGLVAMYAAAVASAPDRFPFPVAEARRIRTIRAWDDAIVAPRWGFEDASHYYAEASVAPRLADLRVPALLVAAEHDPMIPVANVRDAVARAPRELRAFFVRRAGHLGFPDDLDLGLPGPRGADAQALAFLLAHAGEAPIAS